MSAQINVPKLRFPEFSEEYKKTSLGDIAHVYDGTHQTPKYVEEGIPFVSVENINNIEKTEKFITPEAFEKEYKIKPQKYDILMTRITAGIIGATAIVKNNNPLAFYVSLALIRKKNDTIDTFFLSHSISSTSFKKELHKRIIHIAFPKKINLGEIGNCELHYPKVQEQQKIASFLSAVDTKINQITSKKELLEQYKKGVMQNIFSQKLRFKADGGSEFPEWEEKELGQLCKVRTGKLDANAMVPNGQYRFYTCAKEYCQIDEYAFDTDALIISGNGANVGYIHHYKGKFNAYQRTYVLDKFEDNIVFVKYFLDKFLYGRIFTEKKEGNTPYIVLSTLTEMPINLPTYFEQTKIANFLSAIDTKIDLAAKQLDATKQFKKALLQQMFV